MLGNCKNLQELQSLDLCWTKINLSEKVDQLQGVEIFKFIGAPGRNRTCGAWIRNPLLYPLSYGGLLVILMGYALH
jgi:hypothetical protein